MYSDPSCPRGQVTSENHSFIARASFKDRILSTDQTIVAEAVRRALVDQPRLDFHYCANPEDALLVAQVTRPTVILQDLVMPGVDG